MKLQQQKWARAARALGAGSLIIILTVVAAWRVLSQSTAPALSIAPTGTNEVALTVINGSATNLYEIWWTEFLDADALFLTNGTWIDVYDGTTGQTNFVLDLGDTVTGFFRAINGNDLDNDGIPNWQDSRPWDPSVGILTETIETPANGSNVR
jgi:hypothetical protein